MKHYLEQIQEDHERLSPEALLHIQECAVCRAEYNLMVSVQQAIAELPLKKAPVCLKERVFERLLRPAYSLWHLGLAILLLLCSPLLLARHLSWLWSDPMLIGLFSFFGFFTMLLLLPIAFQLRQTHGNRIEALSRSCDEYLDQPLRRVFDTIQKKFSA